MTKSLWKNILKDISKTKARFISIMLIVALGVGFFTGVKATSPSMNKTAEDYYLNNHLMDIRLLSTVGFNDKDVEEIEKLSHIRDVMPSYFTDVIIADNGTGQVIRLYSNPAEDENGVVINEPIVKEGRLPGKVGEIALENATFNSGDYKIGDTFSLNPKVGNDDVSDTLENIEYTVVGFVQSPLYVSFERGTTTVGNGNIHMFGIVSPEEFKSDRYTQIYVLTDYSDGSINTVSAEFDSLIDELEPSFKELGLERAKDFDEEYLDNAKQELADAQAELDSEKDKAEKELSDAKKKLDDGEKEYSDKIGDAQKELDDAKKQIEDGEKAIEDGWEEYNTGIEEGQKKLDDSKAQLKDAQEQLNSAKSEYNAKIREAEKKLNEGEREYNSGLEEYNNGLSEYNAQTAPAKIAIAALQVKYDTVLNKFENITKPACEKLIESSQTANDSIDSENERLQSELDNTEDILKRISLQGQIDVNKRLKEANDKIIERENKKIKDGQAEVDEAKTALDDASKTFEEQTAEPKQQLDDAKSQLDDAKSQLDSGKAELAAQKSAAEAQFAAAQETITQGQAALTEGQTELSKQKTEGRQKLKDSEAELKSAKEEYDKGKEEFEKQKSEGRQKLDDAKKEYEDGKKEAEDKINDAQAKIDSAAEKLDKLENPEWYFMTRLDNPGYQSLIDDTTRVDAVAAVFPLFFLMVAALVCLTTLKRHVEEKRTEIGTLKALGYSNGAIKMQYVVYATCAAFVGCVVGITVGVAILPYVIYNAYGIMYELLPLELSVPVNIAAVGVVTAFVCTTAVALYSCRKSLKAKPSELMRPKAPKIGKRIMLERIPFIWNRMNFTSKVTARNIARYKARFFMTVIGVAGCTALILTGFGLKNSISSISDKQFGEIYTYDMIAILNEEGTAHQNKAAIDFINENELVEAAMLDRQISIEVRNSSGGSLNDSVYLFVPQSAEDMAELIHLRERKSGNAINLDNNGVVVTEKMANTLSIKQGDSITIVDDHKEYNVTVTGISENYINGYVFITPEYYSEIYGKAPLFNMVMCKMTEVTDENESKLGSKCLDNDGIAAVSFISGSISTFQDTIKSLDTVILVLIICAGMLAVVVLYNLTNINVAERVREIATIKVLGFYNGETCAFVYRENIVLTMCGIIAGLGLGIILHRFVILTIEINKTMFGRDISIWSYLFAVGLTAVFAALVNFVMYFKIKKIDMVESLKSIE